MAVDIIIHTISGRNNETLKSVEKLKGHLDYKLIIVKDAKTPSHARNIGVSQAKNDIVVIMDDDLNFTPENFMLLLSKVRRKACVLAKACTLVMYRKDYISLGGFEERLFKFAEDDTEFGYRLARMGYKIILCDYPPCDLVQHLGTKINRRKILLRSFNESAVDLRYNQRLIFKRFLKHLCHVHPIIFLAHFSYALGLVYYPVRMRFGRRSIFEPIEGKKFEALN